MTITLVLNSAKILIYDTTYTPFQTLRIKHKNILCQILYPSRRLIIYNNPLLHYDA